MKRTVILLFLLIITAFSSIFTTACSSTPRPSASIYNVKTMLTTISFDIKVEDNGMSIEVVKVSIAEGNKKIRTLDADDGINYTGETRNISFDYLTINTTYTIDIVIDYYSVSNNILNSYTARSLDITTKTLSPSMEIDFTNFSKNKDRVDFEVQLDKKNHDVNNFSVYLADDKNLILSKLNKDDGISITNKNSCFFVGLPSETNFRLIFAVDLSYRGDEYKDIVINSYDFKTGNYDYLPTASFSNIKFDKDQVTFDVKIEDSSNIINTISVVIVDNTNEIIGVINPEDGLKIGMNLNCYFVMIKPRKSYKLQVLANYKIFGHGSKEDILAEHSFISDDYIYEDRPTITFNSNQTTSSTIQPITVDAYETIILPTATSNIIGTDLVWNTKADGSGINYYPDDTYVVRPQSITFYAYGKPEDYTSGLEFTLINNDSEYAVSYTSILFNDHVIIPSGYNGKAVTRITKITGSYIKSITISSNIKNIDSFAFEGCLSLEKFIVADTNSNFTTIDDNLYSKDGKILINYARGKFTEKFTIPSNVTTIDSYAFNRCTLKEIIIPSSVTTIGSYAFAECTSLSTVTISEGSQLNSIGSYAFESCIFLTTIAIPNSVIAIESYAFFACINLATVIISEESQLNSIGFRAFYQCTSLSSITIPNSVTIIDTGAFDQCASLKRIIVAESNPSFMSIDDNLYSKDGKVLIQYAVGKSSTSFVIPDSVTTIGDYAFHLATLTSISLPSSVTTIGYCAFYACIKLKTVTFSGESQLTIIGSYAFRDCTSLTSITIPNNVTTIDSCAFYNCTSLSTVIISQESQLTIIGSEAFYRCTALTSITIPNNVTTIETNAFFYCTNLVTVIISEESHLTTIESYAFDRCFALTTINIPSSVTTIGHGIFSLCFSLERIIVAESNPNFMAIDDVLYSKDGKILIQYAVGKSSTSFTIPNSVITIGGYAFAGCMSLETIIIGNQNQLTSIGSGAFLFCESLISITIPNSVTTIGSSAFYDCNSLTSIAIPNGVTSIEFGTFYYCSSLTSIIIPNSLTAIGSEAFYRCISLTSITIPSSVISIGSDAFYNWSSSQTIYIQGHSAAPTGWNSAWNYYCFANIVWNS